MNLHYFYIYIIFVLESPSWEINIKTGQFYSWNNRKKFFETTEGWRDGENDAPETEVTEDSNGGKGNGQSW